MPPPPSPNRKRVDRFRWNRHYFHKKDRFLRWRTKLSILAIVVSGGWLALGWTLPEEDRQLRYTHGPIANPHLAWEKNCQACHASYSVDGLNVEHLLDVHSRWHDFRCDTCHHGSADAPRNYAPHHFAAEWNHAKETDCGHCHHDHQGRDVSLVKLPDSDCTVCHKDLNAHHKHNTPKYLSGIGRFEAGQPDSHPEFRKVAAGRAVERTLRFDHARHLRPGMKLTEEQTQGLFTLDQVTDPRERERFRLPGQKDSDLVTLSCAQCHESDAAGAYMRPIQYQTHCQACHSTETGPLGFAFGLSLKSVKVPHGVPVQVLEETLRSEIVGNLSTTMKPPSTLPKMNVGERLDPRVDWELEQLRSLKDLTNALVKRAHTQLGENTCAKCHESKSGKVNSLDVARPNMPSSFYPQAKFNHTTHRTLSCASCHPANFQPGVRAQPELLDLPGIDNCRQCHAPAHQVKVGNQIEPRGGVRHGCVDCHRYHNGDTNRERSRWPDPTDVRRLDADEFLRGLRQSTKRKDP